MVRQWPPPVIDAMLRQRNDALCATGLEAKLIVTYQGTATDDDDESDADTSS